MAPAALFDSSSGGSSPVNSPGLSTPVMVGEGDNDSFTPAHHGSSSSSQPTHQQPIAIVGMACRLPGGANSPAEFWELCSRARSGYRSGVPKERFNHDAFYHSNPGKTGAYHAQGGYFLSDDPAVFDAPFFSLTEKEAIAMDPQQRLLLECTFEALENAGMPKQSIVGRDIGVFIGGSLSEYETHIARDADSMPMHQSTGCASAMQSNRLSHFFDFRGPSFTLDTACSSSLVALHVACQSIRNGEAEVAITGGCHLNMLPDSFISFSTGRLLSDSGRSIAFDERGTGFGRGEGCGILVLKPLNKAIADKDAIRAVIRGTGINQDGKTAGITMPNGDAQEKLINQVYNNAGLDPLDCGFVEAHGTGTKIGDPTEAGAIYRSLGQNRSSKDPLYIGSVKSNIGHLEAASGIAAVIKATLSLERGFVLPNHDFKKPNTKIPWKEWNLVVPKTQRPWPKGKKYISVNNFGFGGTNAHIVLERAPFPVKKPSMSRKATGLSELDSTSHKRLFLLSGNDKQSLEAVMANLVVYLEQRPEIFQSDLLEHLSYTLTRRSLLKWRVAVPATTSFELIEALNSNGILPSKASVPAQGLSPDLRLGFIFTGQGAQWHAMGRELYGPQGFRVYTAALDRADRYLSKLGAEWSLVDELIRRDADASRISDANISQPACTAVQLCLVDLLRSWGIRPAAVAGHSSGEIAAAYAAGFITFKAAVAIAYHRGRMVPILKESFPRLEGTMMAVGGSKEEMQTIIDGVNSTPALQEQGAQIRIACYNSPSSLTVSGDAAGITLLESIIREHHPDTFNRRLQVDVAYHSHHMNLVAKEYKDSLDLLDQPKSVGGTKFYSSLYGRQIDGAECDAAYWVDNLTRPVRFSEALTSMVEPTSGDEPATVSMLVELGPHSALQGPTKQILQAAGVGKDVSYCSALVRKRGAIDSALDLASYIIAKGGSVHVDAVNTPGAISNGKASLLTDLPRYAWNHQKRYWHETRLAQMHNHRGANGARSELIGLEAIYSTNLEPTWRNVFFLDDLPWLRHHRIQGMVVFPLAAFVTMAVEAASQQARTRAATSRQTTPDIKAIELRDVEVLTPLAFPADVVDGNSNIELSISLRRRHNAGLEETWDEFHICSWSAGKEWTEHCVGLVMARPGDNLTTTRHQDLVERVTLATQQADAAIIGASEASAMYTELSGHLGVEYGPSFQAIQDCKVADHFAAGNVSTTVSPDMAFVGSSSLHPAVLESVIEMYWPILRNHKAEDKKGIVYLPSSIRHMCIATSGEAVSQPISSTLQTHCSAQFGRSQPRPTSVDILATAASRASSDVSNFVVAIEGLVVSPILDGDSSSLDNAHAPREVCYKLDWEPLGRETEEAQPIDRPLPDTDWVIVYSSKGGSLSFLLSSQLAVALDLQTARLPTLEEDVFDQGITRSAEDLATLFGGKTCIVLTEIDQAFLADVDEHQFETLKALATNADRILWITRGAYLASTKPSANMISGLSRTVRSEATKPFAHLDWEATADFGSNAENFSTVIVNVLGAAFGSAKTGDMEFAYRSDTLFVPRVVSDTSMDLVVQRETNPEALELQPYDQASANGRALRMQFEAARLPLKGLAGPAMTHEVSFVEDTLAAEPLLGEDEIEFEVKAVGVTTHDALVASTKSVNMGLEASGVVTRSGRAVTDPGLQRGCRIACLTTAMKQEATAGAYASLARTTATLAIPLLADAVAVAFEQAAVLPLAYATAHYSLINQARLEAGQRVLITCSSASVAQAAVFLSLREQAMVYILVSTPEEKSRIVERYAGIIPEGHIVAAYSSNNAACRETYNALKGATAGRGFDVILDLHAGMLKKSHVQEVLKACVAPFGSHIHIREPCLAAHAASSHDLHVVHSSSFLDELSAPNNASFITVDMFALARERPQVLDRVFAKVAALFQAGKVEQLQDVEVMPFSQAHEALNSLHAAENALKKIVLVPRDDDMVLAPPQQAVTSASILKADATYVIVGGTGGLGRSMAKWMVQNGARYIVLLSRRATITPAVQTLLDDAAASKAQIFVRQCDVARESSVASLLDWIVNDAKLPPTRGIIHSAMVLHDVLFEKMSHAEYKAVTESKVQGAWNLHAALDGTSQTHTALDFFVAISSVSAIVGNRGQAAYAAANTYLDALVQHRLAKGLPAVSLALAAVSDAGYLADAEGGAARAADVLRNLGGDAGNTVCEAEVLALLRAAVVGDTASCGHHVITGVAVKGLRPQPFWAADAKFDRILGELDADGGDGENEGGVADVVLSPSLSQAEAEGVVCRGLVAKIAVVLMMEPEELDVTRSLSHYHLDSLVAIEVRNFIARQYEASLQVLELLSSGSIQTLSAIVCRKSKLCQAS